MAKINGGVKKNTNNQIRRLDRSNCGGGGRFEKIEKENKPLNNKNKQQKKPTKRKVGRSVDNKKTKKFVKKTFQKPTKGSEFGQNLYQFVQRIFTVKDGYTSKPTDTMAVTLEDALKEVKLIDKAIKRIKFGKTSNDERISMLKSLNALSLRKRAFLAAIAKANVENAVVVNIAGKEMTVNLFTGRVHLKEMKEYVKRLKASKLEIGPNNVEDIIREIESTLIEIDKRLTEVSKDIYIAVPAS